MASDDRRSLNLRLSPRSGRQRVAQGESASPE